MIRKDWNFCDQFLQAEAIVDKKLKVLIFCFSNFSSSFSLKSFSVLYSIHFKVFSSTYTYTHFSPITE